MSTHRAALLRGSLLFCILAMLAACGQPAAVTTREAPAVSQPTAIAPTLEAPAPDVETAIPALQGLSFDEFLDQSYILLLLRDPERITYEGLYEELDVRNDQLNDLSEELPEVTALLDNELTAFLTQIDAETGFADRVHPYNRLIRHLGGDAGRTMLRPDYVSPFTGADR